MVIEGEGGEGEGGEGESVDSNVIYTLDPPQW
jgi:hypothetical protein